MPYYYDLKSRVRSKSDRERAINNLLLLKTHLDTHLPDKDTDNNLLLATWNIRDLGKRNRRGYGNRMSESLYYIAEVISRFDIVAIQEVNELDEWKRIMDILGDSWDYIATDVTDRALGGNGERMVFVYDKRKVWFKNIAGEVVLPPKMMISQVETKIEGKKVIAGKQFHRTPFIGSFQSGWFKFDLCTVHLYYGAAYGKKLVERIDEIGKVASFMGKRADKAMKEDRALILLGDFNIVHPNHKTMKALTDTGFIVPKSLQRKTNIGETKYYDQIAFKTKPKVIEFVEKRSSNPKLENAGVFKMFDAIYTEKQYPLFKEDMMKCSAAKKAKTEAALKKVYKTWRTYQFSDHYPLWVRLNTNDSQAYLKELLSQVK